MYQPSRAARSCGTLPPARRATARWSWRRGASACGCARWGRRTWGHAWPTCAPGGPGQAAPLGANAPALPALIVSGLDHTDGSLGQFLDAVQRGGAGIPLRAMVTPVSRTWTLAELLNELNAEHKAVRGQA